MRGLGSAALLAGVLVFFQDSAQSDTSAGSDPAEAVTAPVVNTVEESRPLFDPETFDRMHPKAAPEGSKDKFYKNLRKKREEFVEDQRKRRRDFTQDLQKKDLPYEAFQEKLASFNEKERKRQEKFYTKQTRAIQKHQEKLREKADG